jgi:hypothetical protein
MMKYMEELQMLMVSHHRLFRIYGCGFPDAVVKGRNNAISDGTHEEEVTPKKRPNLRANRDVVVESSPGTESDSDDEVPSTNDGGGGTEKSEQINDDDDHDDDNEYEH